jgi:hypothetical protein
VVAGDDSSVDVEGILVLALVQVLPVHMHRKCGPLWPGVVSVDIDLSEPVIRKGSLCVMLIWWLADGRGEQIVLR